MFTENAHPVALILHAMNVIKMPTQHVHPRQVPVITLDQPLFAIEKGIQWNLPNTHGESKVLCIYVRWMTYRNGSTGGQV